MEVAAGRPLQRRQQTMTATSSNAGPAPDVLLWMQLSDGHRYENLGDGRLRQLTADDLPWIREEEP